MAVRLGKAQAALAGALFLLSWPASAQVPDPWAGELAHQLTVAEAPLREQGYMRLVGPLAGGLAHRATQRFPVTLRAGQDYEILGVCDARCGDMDMRIYDSAGDLTAEIALADDTPIMHVRPRVTGTHTIEVTLFQCGAARCYFAFNLYAR